MRTSAPFSLAVTALASCLLFPPAVLADVSPASLEAEVAPGESVDVDKLVTLPEDTPKLDIVLLVDLSGSYANDLPNIRAVAPGLFDDIRTQVPDSRFAVASFIDFPFSPWGNNNNYAYRLEQDFSYNKTDWTSALNGLVATGGNDSPESQYEAIFQAVSGLGREMPITTNGSYTDVGEIAPGQNVTFRPDATRVLAITTDASFHNAGDSGLFPYPGASRAETIAELQAAGVQILAIKAPGATTQMNDLAAATGGTVVNTTSTSSNIAEAILSGLETLTYTVTATPQPSCDPLAFDYTPPAHDDVEGGDTVGFLETITVPGDITAAELDADGNIVCSVEFLAGDTVVGVQEVLIHVPLNNPPVALCQDLLLAAGDDCLADGDIDNGSFDPDGDALTYAYSESGPWTVGSRDVTLTVTDPDGAADSCTAEVTVFDDSAPEVETAGLIEIWPPNHKHVEADLADCVLSITDNCGGDIDIADTGIITSIYSDEPEDVHGRGDGNTLDDIVIVGDTAFDVRAERQGAGNGRVYGVSFEVSDGAGNSTPVSCSWGVPHSQNGDAPVDDGPSAGYTVD